MFNNFKVQATIAILTLFVVLMMATGILSFAAFVTEGNNEGHTLTVSALSFLFGFGALKVLAFLSVNKGIDEALLIGSKPA